MEHSQITLIVPVKNESLTINALWESILKQTRQPDGIVFVDGGSNDDTIKLLYRLTDGDSRVQIIASPGAFPGVGRNIGIEHSVTEWNAFTDAGIILSPDWLEQLEVVALTNPTLQIIYGNYEPVVSTFFEQCAAFAYVPEKISINSYRMRRPFIASCLLRKSLWQQIGGFPASRAAEDLVFFKKVQEGKYNQGWAPLATVHWQLQPNIRTTFNKFKTYSMHNVWIGMQRYWHYGIARQYIVYIMLALLSFVHSVQWFVLLLFLFILRAIKNIYTKSEHKRLSDIINPVQMLGVIGIMVIIDCATFYGWLIALISTPDNISQATSEIVK